MKKPSERIKEIMADIAKRNTEEARAYAMKRGVPESALTITYKPDDPGLIPEAIMQFLDEHQAMLCDALESAHRFMFEIWQHNEVAESHIVAHIVACSSREALWCYADNHPEFDGEGRCLKNPALQLEARRAEKIS